mmetsp:Transcript_2423/g.8648  ORF Transcript_2423/g.8648 Transcript_2423/m.8648 type:complete len:249 (-) Transcript_2423:298-1044(-)
MHRHVDRPARLKVPVCQLAFALMIEIEEQTERRTVRVKANPLDLPPDRALDDHLQLRRFGGELDVLVHLGSRVAHPHQRDVARNDVGSAIRKELSGGLEGVGEAVPEHIAQLVPSFPLQHIAHVLNLVPNNHRRKFHVEVVAVVHELAVERVMLQPVQPSARVAPEVLLADAAGHGILVGCIGDDLHGESVEGRKRGPDRPVAHRGALAGMRLPGKRRWRRQLLARRCNSGREQCRRGVRGLLLLPQA